MSAFVQIRRLRTTSLLLKVPAIYDSKGVLSILDRFRRPTQARWVPAVDTNLLARREGKQESYWAVGLHSGKFMAIILKVRLTILRTPLHREIDPSVGVQVR